MPTENKYIMQSIKLMKFRIVFVSSISKSQNLNIKKTQFDLMCE